MWAKFKWDMLITSFIPLWLSIVILDIFEIISFAINSWEEEKDIFANLLLVVFSSEIQLVSIVVVVLLVIISSCGINLFLKERERSSQNPSAVVLKAQKANKLSSEFLLAYILPLIAFDFGKLEGVVLFIVYFSILAFLCIRNNNIYTNIMLEFKNYRLYCCDIQRTLPGGLSVVYYESLVISKQDLSAREAKEIKCWDCDNYIYIHIKEKIESE